MKKIGFLGLGTVGSGVFEILTTRKDYLESLLGEELFIKSALIKDIDKKRSETVSKEILTTDAYDILNDDEIDIIVEVMNGEDLPYEYIKYALNSGKHVVSANKAVISKHLMELLQIAEKNGVKFIFEGSVGGGTPIIKPLIEQTRTNEVTEIAGILNGTTNFILSQMVDENKSFEEALKSAQELGYSELDPTSDIEGIDALRKIVILSMLAFKASIDEDEVVTRGVSKLNKCDIEIFKEMKLIPKLMAKSVNNKGNISIVVEPVLVEENSIFAKVDNSYNMVNIEGDYIGNLKFYGQGAGKNPTGNAVVNDILDILTNSYPNIHFNNSKIKLRLDKLSGNYYFRFINKLEDNFRESFGRGNYNLIKADEKYTYVKTTKLSFQEIQDKMKKFNYDEIFYARIEN